MSVLKVPAIVLLLFHLVQQNAARIKHSEEYIGKTKNKQCDCGVPYVRTARILGPNTEVENRRRYPWMVGLVRKGKIICGGSIIDTQYILTAAHCLESLTTYDGLPKNVSSLKPRPRIDVALNVYRTNKRMVIVKMGEYFVHPTFDNTGENPFNDIALVRLEKPLFYTKSVRPICLSVDPNMTTPGTTVKVTGFGYTRPRGKVSRILRETSLPILRLDECRKKLNVPIMESAICAGGLEGRDACQGDSGGPLFYTDNEDRSYQVGVVSWGQSCGKREVPAVYTRINVFLHWIRNITADSPSCELMFPPLVVTNSADCGIPETKCNGEIPCNSSNQVFSWMARIMYKDKYLGTGVLINRTYVLTSTEVISPWQTPSNSSAYHVILGTRSEKQDRTDTGEFRSGISHLIVHPYLEQVSLVLVKLNITRKDLTQLHRPLCMPEVRTRNNRTNQIVSAMFWKNDERKSKNTKRCKRSKTESCRKTNGTDVQSSYINQQAIRQAKKTNMKHEIEILRIVKRKTCNATKTMKDHIICTVVEVGDICHEKGATLMHNVGGRFYLLGVIAKTDKKCSKVKMFHDISCNLKWIQGTLDNMYTLETYV